MSSFEMVLKNYFRYYAFYDKSVCAFLYNSYDAPLHQHCDFYEFTLVTYGNFKNEYNGKIMNCPKNTLFFFKTGATHNLWSDQEDSVHFTFIVHADYFENAFKRYFPDISLDSLDDYVQTTLSKYQSEYLNMLASKQRDYARYGTDNIFVQLFLFNALSFCILSDRETDLAPLSKHQYIENLLIRLNNFTYIKHSVNQIYKDYPIAQSSLITLFKERTGKTIVQYHNMKKIEYAAQLLSTYKYSVTDVCLILQYSSLSHFGKLFKEQYGISPKEYKRLHLDEWAPQEPNEKIK